MRFLTAIACSTLLTATYASPLSSNNGIASTNTFENPILWQDYPDLEVIRVGDVFYYTSSTFAFSPGAPILKSYDLVNWTPVTHSVPTLNFGEKYDLGNETQRGYVKGIWASSLRYRDSTDTFYWLGCVESSKSYLWTASNTSASTNNGEVDTWTWTPGPAFNKCFYDCGILIDDDDTIYVAHGSTNISVSQLSSDATSEVRSQVVFMADTYIEGARMYNINGSYYIFVTRPAAEEWVLKSSTGSPWGPYEMRPLVQSIPGPLENAGFAHQGGIVDTRDGAWYYVAFLDAYPGGRIPVMAPITWDEDGWPEVVRDGEGRWGESYPLPIDTNKTVPEPWGKDSFAVGQLSPAWEWSHNPDTSKFSLLGGENGGGLRLETASVTTDLYAARNTLTHRVHGPKSVGTFHLDVSAMADGDRAGAALFRDTSAYIGVHVSGSTRSFVFVDGLSLDANRDWSTNSTGSVVTSTPLPSHITEIYLRVEADITPAFSTDNMREATFSYSVDGVAYQRLGGAFKMSNDWRFFTGYRFAVFNFATRALGGEVLVRSFEMESVV